MKKLLISLVVICAICGSVGYTKSQAYLEKRADKYCNGYKPCECAIKACGYMTEDKSICHKMLDAIKEDNRIKGGSLYSLNEKIWGEAIDICKRELRK